MEFCFNQQTCQNIRKSLRKEWLETNDLGDYCSTTLIGCNTRRYHGLFVANLERPAGRHVLLSSMEENLQVGGREFSLSCRRHPGLYYPRGHEYLSEVQSGEWTTFKYRVGDVKITRETLLVRGRHLLLRRYQVSAPGVTEPMTLRLRPLLAFRSFHALTHANMDLQVKTFPARNGFTIRPYNALPPFFMGVGGAVFEFFPSPDWYRNVEYMADAERGFDHHEDLFNPGFFDVTLSADQVVYFAASLETDFDPADADALWKSEMTRRAEAAQKANTIEGHLARDGRRYIITTPSGASRVLAGYHWFDAWGRDTMIALPGLTTEAGRAEQGQKILGETAASVRNGLIPNCFALGDEPDAWNSADGALWFAWALQRMEVHLPGGLAWIKDYCWPALLAILSSWKKGLTPHVWVDDDGLVSVGSSDTQLTWMDAQVDGQPVTPRWGYPVEIQALWYNAWAYACDLARRLGEPLPCSALWLEHMAKTFVNRFWVEDKQPYLADVWRSDYRDESIRPNQIFAAALPFSMLDDEQAAAVVESVRKNLLSPYGLCTLSPRNPLFRPHYQGDSAERDSAYHQGTVWPWLLGAYGDALERIKGGRGQRRVAELLSTLRPLFAQHLGDAGIGSVSEIFDGAPPYEPKGCIAQAWSVAECLRMLLKVKARFPELYKIWEADVRQGGGGRL